MSPITPAAGPRLLLFPQVGRPDGKDGGPAVRRYALTMLPGGRPAARAARPAAKPARS